jgi:hypothetical protein
MYPRPGFLDTFRAIENKKKRTKMIAWHLFFLSRKSGNNLFYFHIELKLKFERRKLQYKRCFLTFYLCGTPQKVSFKI